MSWLGKKAADVIVSGQQLIDSTITAAKLVANAVTYAKMQQVTAGKVLGRDTSGTGNVQELPIAVDSSGNVGIGANAALYGEKLFAYTNSTQNAIGGEIGPNASGCTAVLATSQSGATNSDLFGAWHANVNQFRVNTAGVMMFNSGYGQSAVAYGCRAWVNFNGTGTVAIRGSGNVSSITDNGVGDYTVNFTTALPDVNYNVVGTANVDSQTHGNYIFNTRTNGGWSANQLTGSVRVIMTNGGTATLTDTITTNVSIFR